MDQSTEAEGGSPANKASTLDRALRLIEFLKGLQLQKTRPVRTIQQYLDQGGRVLWFHTLPVHSAVASAHLVAQPSPDEPFLVIDRVARLDPPLPDAELRPWLDMDRARDPNEEPQLHPEIVVSTQDDDGESTTTVQQLHYHPEVREQFASWLILWRAWAASELTNKPVRDLYASLFAMSEQVAAAPEEMEAVVALGCLNWKPESHDEVARHLLTVPAQLSFDDKNGRITVAMAANGVTALSLELDMIDPNLWPSKERGDEIKASLASYESHAFDREQAQLPLIRLVNNLDPGGRYLPNDEPARAFSDASVSFAPALIVRKRSNRALLRIFEEIRLQLEASGVVPEGLVPLVEVVGGADLELPEGGDGSSDSASDGFMYLPLPANDEQHRIVRQVSTRRHTVVQGPPGTGKTHTIANLLSHLLAQGLRVLITAHTDRALRELKSKLPDELSALCVSAVGQARTDLADLKVAVNTIASRAAEHDPNRESQRIAHLKDHLNELRSDRASAQARMIDVRQVETKVWGKGSFNGTLAEIAIRHGEGAETFKWLSKFSPDLSSEVPIDNEEAQESLHLLCDSTLAEYEERSREDLVEAESIPSPSEFRHWTDAQKLAAATARTYETIKNHDSYASISSLDPGARNDLRKRLSRLATIAATLSTRDEQWMSSALADVTSGKPEVWANRHEAIARLLAESRPVLDRLGTNPEVQVVSGKPEAFVTQARELREHLASGGKLTGLIKPKPVKNASELFAQVRVGGMPPRTVAALDTFIDWVLVMKQLNDAERLWPSDVEIPKEDTFLERWAWNKAEVGQLEKVIDLAQSLRDEEARLEALGVPKPDWTNLESVQAYEELVEAVAAHETSIAAQAPLDTLRELVHQAAMGSRPSKTVIGLLEAVSNDDPDRYREAHSEALGLLQVRRQAARRDAIMERLATACPSLASALKEAPNQEAQEWESRLATLASAWEWCAVGQWIDEKASQSIDRLQEQMKALEDRIQETVAELTAAKAWAHAVERLGPPEQQSLRSYALAVRQLGRGTGRYAPHRRTQAQIALADCRPAVPAWIMPIYRIADTLRVEPDAFDVVIIDEASQAGVEASFLQYLAPRIVVVGDDKQVSPSGVGLERQQLIDLGRQLIDDLPHHFTWTNPETSFFDQARLRYGDVITLREHFRCVPEIIGFSNRIAYEPDNVPLIPLRQYGLDRLEPIKTVHVAAGYTEGRSGNRVNPPEVEQIVETLLKCCGDPAYDDMTMGVISLTGKAQADSIERELLQRLDPREIRAREIRCGDAAAFQGSERDVMFLSMVAVREEGVPLAALTRDMYVQRFNVAGSRAKDQMWVFHSLTIDDLHNRDDMRFQLLDYCHSVQQQHDLEAEHTAMVPEDVQVSPFDSLFEQHVFNRITERGFTVIPQWEVRGYRIDLVVVGGRSRLAVECDGDQWHGQDRYEADLGRQRELERCGWTFKRIRASEFYRDQHRALEPLWELLDRHEIRPAYFSSPEVATSLSEDVRVVDDEAPPEAPHIQSVEELQETEAGEVESTEGEWELDREPSDHLHPVEAPSSKDSFESSDALVTAPDDSSSHQASVSRSRGVKSYTAWSSEERLTNPDMAGIGERIENLIRIVEVEGPIVGRRLYQLYVRSAGSSRVGKRLARLLNLASHSAASSGLLVAQNPLNEQGQQVKTFRLPTQPDVDLRDLGPRTIYEVPPAELASALEYVREGRPIGTEEWYRALLDLYGLQRLTEPTRERIEACRGLI